MDELTLLVHYREFYQYNRIDCTTPQDILSYGKTRPLKWNEANRLLNEINRLEKNHGLPLTPKRALS